MAGCEVSFPNLGIYFENVGKSISVFGFQIAFYGMVITLGMICGYLAAEWQAKRTGQNPELYLDFAIYAIIFSVIGARIYYVIFAWDEFRDRPFQAFNIRTGGLAIYGGVIAGVLTAAVYSKIKKVNFWMLTDTAITGLLTGQIIGRWGNFFNKEAFGAYTNNLFAMRLPWDVARYHVSASSVEELLPHVKDGYIQVHPTFLYESVWNLVLLVLILLYTKHKKFDGELFLLYLGGYGLGRIWIEALRTDQLLLWGTNIAVSQLLAFCMLIFSAGAIFYNRRKIVNRN
ncbi:prolipoprotein diacylglyceryl transferase [[Clostridium] polysaccharolyticum]|uniref:Phosphatidylglycerol--prolipoprotein diacylglyceryl transferase n=1 Tax=[Clostridium] polysaccharolyticum TaxID=29364 RepID=A0A1H9Y0V2_9FIRM|nr:prolipoprotein diacylglyceryl transferase [[Clostridium] polysaccharolyticum]SES62355.1 phosphatidylglycerol:prolipoprotein diacylglycerol transferase [[Clostridium] polysaccharolyticum]